MDAECIFKFFPPILDFVKYSHFKPFTNLYDVCKSDNINVNDVCVSLFVLPGEDRIQDTLVQDRLFWTKMNKKIGDLHFKTTVHRGK